MSFWAGFGCGAGTSSYAWVDPHGTSFELRGQTQGQWASEFFKDHLLPEPQFEGIDELLGRGWVRVVNPTTIMVGRLSTPTPKAWQTVVEILVGCILETQENPESLNFRLAETQIGSNGGTTHKMKVADFVEKFGTRSQNDKMWDGLLDVSSKIPSSSRVARAHLKRLNARLAIAMTAGSFRD